VSKSRTGLADSHCRLATCSAMDDDGVPLLLLTLSAIDSDEITVGCLRMGVGCCCRMDTVGDVTINWGGKPASKGISSLLPMSNCTLGVASICTPPLIAFERSWIALIT